MPTYYSKPSLYKYYKPNGNTLVYQAEELRLNKIPYTVTNGIIEIGTRQNVLSHGDVILINDSDLPSGLWGLQENDEYSVISESAFQEFEQYIDGYYIDPNEKRHHVNAFQHLDKQPYLTIDWLVTNNIDFTVTSKDQYIVLGKNDTLNPGYHGRVYDSMWVTDAGQVITKSKFKNKYCENPNDARMLPDTPTTKQLARIFDKELLHVHEGEVRWREYDYNYEPIRHGAESDFDLIDTILLKEIFAHNLGDSKKTMRDYITAQSGININS